MVFSFFKKPPKKIPARPRAPELIPVLQVPSVALESATPLSQPLPDLEFTTGHLPSAAPSRPQPFAPIAPAAPVTASEPASIIEDFEREFTESSVMGIDLDNNDDPVQANVEHVVVMFANGQDAAARALLEMLVRTGDGGDNRRFWLLLFDFLQAVGDRASFEELGVEFAEACETSPPTWRQTSTLESAVDQPQLFVLQGVLTAENAQSLLELAALAAGKEAIRVDCGRLLGCDDEVAGQLAEILRRARHGSAPMSLEKVDGLLTRLNERLHAGEARHAPSWDLLLELLQRHATQSAFEDRAINYAITFERSPPSWEPLSPGLAKPPVAMGPARDDAYYLAGDLKNQHFEDLAVLLESQEHPILDFSEVSRLDFFSAGQLVNRLTPCQLAGREVVIRSPNRLVAELMAVVGITKLARIIVPKS